VVTDDDVIAAFLRCDAMVDVKKMVIKNKMKTTTAITSISLVITLSLLLFTGALIGSNDNNVLAKKDGGDSGDKGSSGDGDHHDSGSSKGGSSDGGDHKERIAKPKPEGGSKLIKSPIFPESTISSIGNS
jgi:uncharacterized membrane protein YgcG